MSQLHQIFPNYCVFVDWRIVYHKKLFPPWKKVLFQGLKSFLGHFFCRRLKKISSTRVIFSSPLPTTIEPLDLTIWVEKKEGLLVSFFVKIHPIFNASQQTKSLTRAFEFYYQNILDFRVLDFVLYRTM